MTRRRDIIILAGLFLLLVVFTILGPGQTEEEDFSGQTTTYSSGEDGVLALLRWTQAMGYDARRLEFTNFELDDQTAALFIINPSLPINRTQAAEVIRWVEAGGTLILVDDRQQLFRGQNAIFKELEVDINTLVGEVDAIEQAEIFQPALNDPPLQQVTLNTRRIIDVERDDVAHLLGTDAGTVLLGIQQEAGYIYISSASFPFTNQGLRSEGSAALIVNLLRRVPAGGNILFDEYHHGFFTPPSLRTVLLSKAWGWALLYALAVIAAYLILTGRRFGQPVPLREEITRRSSAEYVESMADLFQRSGKRDFMLRHYYTAFKRRLARPYGINPRLDDEAFVAELTHYRDVHEADLRACLQRLRSQHISEEELLQAVLEADSLAVRK